MLIVFTRAIIIYVFLLVTMRLMGKKQLGELQPFEFAITLIAAELACIPMSDTQVPVIYGLVPIFTMFIIEFLLTKVVKHSLKWRRIINGKAIIVISPQGIDFQAINKLDMTIHDIMEAIRSKNFLSPADIEYAIVETNGDVTVIPKALKQTVSNEDLHINKQEIALPYSLIVEGKRMNYNLKISGVGDGDIEKILTKFSLKQKAVLLLSVTNKDEFYLQPINKPYIVGKISEL
ncbi:MAG: DUF421 domain-containing protein [Clostridia bacterium]